MNVSAPGFPVKWKHVLSMFDTDFQIQQGTDINGDRKKLLYNPYRRVLTMCVNHAKTKRTIHKFEVVVEIYDKDLWETLIGRFNDL